MKVFFCYFVDEDYTFDSVVLEPDEEKARLSFTLSVQKIHPKPWKPKHKVVVRDITTLLKGLANESLLNRLGNDGS